jgi:hypothetical protein
MDGKGSQAHPEGMVESGLSDHESMEPVPVQLTGTSSLSAMCPDYANFCFCYGRFSE